MALDSLSVVVVSRAAERPCRGIPLPGSATRQRLPPKPARNRSDNSIVLRPGSPAWRRRSSTQPRVSGGGLATVNLCQHPRRRTHLQYLRTYPSRQGWPSRGRRRQGYLTASRAFTTGPGPAIRPRP